VNTTRAAHPARLRVVIMAAILAIAALAMSAGQIPSAHATTTRAAGGGGPKPTIVLEHGSWADASSWNAVIQRLQRDGYTVYGPAQPAARPVLRLRHPG
jgi:hypothetical protein